LILTRPRLVCLGGICSIVADDFSRLRRRDDFPEPFEGMHGAAAERCFPVRANLQVAA
jgi:hypothetical protein